MNKKKIVVISGFSGSGKGTVVKRLIDENSDMKPVRSLTTRKPRNIEKDEYIFVSDEEFWKAQRNEELLEFNKYDNHMYGTPLHLVEELLEKGKIPIIEIDPTGYEALKNHLKLSHCDIIGIFLVVCAEEVYERLKNRKTESLVSIISRLKTAKEEAFKADNYDCILENYNTELTVKRIEDYIHNVNRSGDTFNAKMFEHDVDRIISQINDTNLQYSQYLRHDF